MLLLLGIANQKGHRARPLTGVAVPRYCHPAVTVGWLGSRPNGHCLGLGPVFSRAGLAVAFVALGFIIHLLASAP